MDKQTNEAKNAAMEKARYQGGLGDTAMQRAWMRYADANEVPHDHEDEEAFKYGYDAGIARTTRYKFCPHCGERVETEEKA